MATLGIVPIEIESSGVLKESSFSVGDAGFILDILRSKIYSNIKKAICQEYTTNARDAHVEAGKPEVPIEITLPNFLSPTLHIRDFGIGISPDRMENIFIRYGISTKRDSNKQVGAFGVGAKSALGYSDTFQVITRIDGIKRSYTAVIDESRCGKLSLLDESPTDELTGTEIICPIKQQDFQAFINEMYLATKHFSVKPIIKGVGIDYEGFSSRIILEGDTWFIARNLTSGDSRGFKLILSEIEFPFSRDSLFDGSTIRNSSEIPSFSYNATLYLKFPTGALTVSANREQVEQNEKNKEVIYNALKVAKVEIDQKFQESIKDASTWIEANLKFHEIKNAVFSYNDNFDFDLKWNGFPLCGKSVRIEGGSQKWQYSTAPKSKAKKLRENVYHLDLEDKTTYCLNDNNAALTESCVRSVFESLNASNGQTIVIINLINNQLNDSKTGETQEEVFLKRHHFVNGNLPFVRMSKLWKPRKSSVSSSLGRLMFFKFDKDACKFQRTSVEEYENNPSPKTWVRLTKDYDKTINPLINGAKSYDCSNFSKFLEHKDFSDYSIYGFMDTVPNDRISEVTEEMVKIETLVVNFVKETSVEPKDIQYAINKQWEIAEFPFGKEFIQGILDWFNDIDATHLIVKYGDEFEKLESKISDLKSLGFVLPFVPRQETSKTMLDELKKLSNELLKVYPMLQFIKSQHSYIDSKEFEQISSYIEMVDSLNKKQPTIERTQREEDYLVV